MNLYELLLFQLKTTATPLSAIVHVNTKPIICSERIKKRSRTGEEGIPLSYLESLDNYQCKWIENAKVPYISTDLNDIEKVEKFIADLI